jgi:hypothetical protein
VTGGDWYRLSPKEVAEVAEVAAAAQRLRYLQIKPDLRGDLRKLRELILHVLRDNR